MFGVVVVVGGGGLSDALITAQFYAFGKIQKIVETSWSFSLCCETVRFVCAVTSVQHQIFTEADKKLKRFKNERLLSCMTSLHCNTVLGWQTSKTITQTSNTETTPPLSDRTKIGNELWANMNRNEASLHDAALYLQLIARQVQRGVLRSTKRNSDTSVQEGLREDTECRLLRYRTI